MKNYFTISQAAKIVGMTTEALRHYDRINLVKPCKVDEWTGYRYYSQSEIIRLNTIKALQCMDLTLSEIKDILAYDDFGKIIATLKQAEVGADQKIAQLNYAKTKIRRARTFYENKLSGAQPQSNMFVKYYPQRVILLSDTMHAPRWTIYGITTSTFTTVCPTALKRNFLLRIWLAFTNRTASPACLPSARGLQKQPQSKFFRRATIFAPTVRKKTASE